MSHLPHQLPASLTPVQEDTSTSNSLEEHSLLFAMGNVALLSQGNDGALTPFQRSKLIFDFNTFFDLNKDGVLTYKDFLWAKDRICQISGWKVKSIMKHRY